MKKFFICCLCIILSIFIYLFWNVKKENILLNNEIEDLKFKQEEINRKKEEYTIKENQLNSLKEEKKDKILKYEEVSVWNEEIKSYLD